MPLILKTFRPAWNDKIYGAYLRFANCACPPIMRTRTTRRWRLPLSQRPHALHGIPRLCELCFTSRSGGVTNQSRAPVTALPVSIFASTTIALFSPYERRVVAGKDFAASHTAPPSIAPDAVVHPAVGNNRTISGLETESAPNRTPVNRVS